MEMEYENEENDDGRSYQTGHDGRHLLVAVFQIAPIRESDTGGQPDIFQLILHKSRHSHSVLSALQLGLHSNRIDTIPAYNLSGFPCGSHICHLTKRHIRQPTGYGDKLVFQVNGRGTIRFATFQYDGSFIVSFPDVGYCDTIAVAHGKCCFHRQIADAQSGSFILTQHDFRGCQRFVQIGLHQYQLRHFF